MRTHTHALQPKLMTRFERTNFHQTETFARAPLESSTGVATIHTLIHNFCG